MGENAGVTAIQARRVALLGQCNSVRKQPSTRPVSNQAATSFVLQGCGAYGSEKTNNAFPRRPRAPKTYPEPANSIPPTTVCVGPPMEPPLAATPFTVLISSSMLYSH